MVLNPFHIAEADRIKNIIFDFGGVICDIDVSLTEKRFYQLGLHAFDTQYSVVDRDSLFAQLEEGTITPEAFRAGIRTHLSRPVTDQEIDDAWNALLLTIPPERIRLLESLRGHYRIFLLSNSNTIHYDRFRQDFEERFGYRDFDRLFEKAYFSFRIHLKKPGREIFEYLLADAKIAASDTLFIDDSIQHVEGARAVGISAFHLVKGAGDPLMELFVKPGSSNPSY